MRQKERGSTMSGRLQQRVLEAVRRHKMMQAGDRVGVAVSGGADSVALLLLLAELRHELGIRLLVVHFNHQLRPRDADADEQFVAGLASERGLEFVVGREDVAAEARRHRWNLEEAARRLRYRFFADVVNSGCANHVAVAHTADDQAETLFAHLLRGTGPTGLAAIYPVAGHVVRPLLEVRRVELREYLAGRQQDWHEDLTNLDMTRLRARLRHHVLPQLERDFQPALVAHLCRLAALAREDEVFWDALVANRYSALVGCQQGARSIRIADLLDPLPLDAAERPADPTGVLKVLSKRLVRHIFQEVRGSHLFTVNPSSSSARGQLTARHVEQVIHLATACASGHRVHLPGGVDVERNFDLLVFSLARQTGARPRTDETESGGRSYQYVVELAPGGATTVSVPEIRRRFRLKVIDWPVPASETRLQAGILDADRLRSPLVLRNWRPGDSYRPDGRQRVRKVKRLLLENRVAARERVGWPVLTSAGALVWARRLPVAAEVAPQKATKTGLVIAEETL